MGCFGDRESQDDFLRSEQRWDYINLDDFKNKSCFTPFAYFWLLLMLLVSVSVYAVDTFTAINLVAFDRWSGQIQPAIPFSIARWIFAGCIIASFILLFYRWWRAIKVMKQGGVAKSYLDPLAVRIQSIRMGKEGRGFKRFLVFAELTKSRKGADYVALFSYFSFEAWLRIIFAEGPRQVVNAITLYSVMRAKLIPEGDHNTEGNNSAFVQFWINLGRLANQDKLQAAILLGMLWTLLIWVLAALSLLISVILFIIFLWHHIPKGEGGLSGYCRNKINRRMERVVKVKVDKALKKENENRQKEEAKAERNGLKLKTQPTLPDIGAAVSGQKHAPLSRQDTMTTLPEYESREGSLRHSDENAPPIPSQFNDPYRPGPKRNGTQRSDASYSSYHSNAPLMSSAAEMGMQTPGSADHGPWPGRHVPRRSASGFSQHSERTTTPGPRPSMQEENSYQMEPLPRSTTSASNSSHGSRPPYPDSDFPPARVVAPTYNQPFSAGANPSHFPGVPDARGNDRFAPGPRPPARSFTYQDPPTRSFTPATQPQRSFTPNGQLLRSNTPGGLPLRDFAPQEQVARSHTPGGPPPRSYTPYDGTARSQPQLHNFSPVDTTQRSHTPGGLPPRSSTPQGQTQQLRSHTPGAPPPRTFTPQGQPIHRPITPHDQPTLPRLDTSGSSYSAYMPSENRSGTPMSAPAGNYNHQNQYHSQHAQQQPVLPQPQYRSYSRSNNNNSQPQPQSQLPPSIHNGNHRDSGFDDILNHYR